MDFKFDLPNDINIDLIHLQKLSFIYNAIEKGWSVKKIEDKYIFSKKHEGREEVYLESFLPQFIKSNFESRGVFNK